MKKLDNIFFCIGIVAFAIMAMQLDFQEVVDGVKRAGYWFPAVIVLWAFLYIINTASWGIIIKSLSPTPTLPPGGGGVKNDSQDEGSAVKTNQNLSPTGGGVGGGLWLYKVTVAGFALNYATPGGLMGGEAYRISQLTQKIGIEKASSSVILYVMTHIFSHFWFWLVSAILYIMCYQLSTSMYCLLAAIMVFCVAAILLFLKGYKNGIVNSLVNIFAKIPFLKKKANAFIEKHKEKLLNIDLQIATLHSKNRTTFFFAVFLEFMCRVLSSFEIMFILLIITPDITFLDSMLILAFTSLFANMLFFLPLQLGGREGGFMLSVSGLSISASAGVFVALIVRLRELFWTGLGLLLIKIGKRN
ncbi:MAG: flippase-like domain-containing protein [Bacteroidaceae bacterium]|nr:flippase-like domain-containing protein [Bacteroidaceae bacterium]